MKQNKHIHKSIAVFLCDKCAEKLQRNKYYITELRSRVPMNSVEIVQVPDEICQCCSESSRKQMKPVTLDSTDDRPWKVVFWENDDERDYGMSSFLGSYTSFADAQSDAIKGTHINDWASSEVQLQIGDGIYSVYCYATTEPYANEFVVN